MATDSAIIAVLTALIGAAGAVAAALADKYDLPAMFKRKSLDLSGNWYGMSAYVPIEICSGDATALPNGSECVYRFSADLRQIGARVQITETINEFFDIELNPIRDLPPRVIDGTGRLRGERDVIVHFAERDSLTCGTMYLTAGHMGSRTVGANRGSESVFWQAGDCPDRNAAFTVG